MAGLDLTAAASARDKALARTRALTRRDTIPSDERTRRSEALCGRLAARCEGALRPGAMVAAYCAMRSEPDLHVFVHEAFDRGCRVCLPCMVSAAKAAPSPEAAAEQTAEHDRARAHMVFLEVDRATFDSREAAFLTNPARAIAADDPCLATLAAVAPQDIDAVAVPLVAFDDANNRLGYGGGNYDRLLEALRGDAVVIGVAFAEQRLDHVPTERHDKPLPRIEAG